MSARRKPAPAVDPAALIANMQAMLSEFRRMRDDLLAAIADEEERSGILDRGHFAYPTFAKAARMRAAKLEEGIARIEGEIATLQERPS